MYKTEEDFNPRFHPSPVPRFHFSSPPDISQWTAVPNFDFSQQAIPKFHFSEARSIIPESNFSSAFGSSPFDSAFGSFPVGSTFGSSSLGSTFGSFPAGSAFGSQQPQTGGFFGAENTAAPAGLFAADTSNGFFGLPSVSKLSINQTTALDPQLVFPSTSTLSASKPSHPEVPMVEVIGQNPAIEGKEEEESLEPLPNMVFPSTSTVSASKPSHPEVPVVEEILQDPAIEVNAVVNGPDCAICVRPILPNEERFQCSDGMRGANHLRVIQPPCGNYLHLDCLNEYLRSYPDPANRKKKLLPKCPNCRGDVTKRCSSCNKKVKRPAYQCRRVIRGRRCPALFCNVACIYRAQHGRADH